MRRVYSLEKTLMLGGIGGRRRRGQHRMRWLDGITDLMDMSLRNWWWIGRPGVLWFMESQRVGHDWATELNWPEVLGLKYPTYKFGGEGHNLTHNILPLVKYKQKPEPKGIHWHRPYESASQGTEQRRMKCGPGWDKWVTFSMLTFHTSFPTPCSRLQLDS